LPVARGRNPSTNLKNLEHFIAIVVDDLDGDLAGLRLAEGRLTVLYRLLQAASSMSARSDLFSLS
jgi:hypothetical protein